MNRNEAMELLKEGVISKDEFLALIKATDTIAVNKEQTKPKNGEIRINWEGMWMVVDVKVKILVNGDLQHEASFKKGFEYKLPLEKDTYDFEIRLGSMKSTKFTLSELDITTNYLIELEYNNTWGKFSKNINLKELLDQTADVTNQSERKKELLDQTADVTNQSERKKELLNQTADVTNQSERKMKGYWPAITGFALIIFVAMSVFEMDFGSNQSNACECEEELGIWARGGDTFNITLKVDCLEKYYGSDITGAFTRLDYATGEYIFLDAWDKAKKACESGQ